MGRYGRGPLFFALVDLLLEGGGEGVAEEDAASVEGDRLAAGEAEAGRCLGGGGLEFLGEADGQFGQQALQGGLRDDRVGRHGSGPPEGSP